MPAGVQASGASMPCTSLPRLTGMQAVHVLARIHPQQSALVVEMGWERILHEVGVHSSVGVEPVDHRVDISLSGVGGQMLVGGLDPQFGAVPMLHGHVVGRWAVVADQHRSQSGRHPAPVQRFDAGAQLATDLAGEALAVEGDRGHRATAVPEPAWRAPLTAWPPPPRRQGRHRNEAPAPCWAGSCRCRRYRNSPMGSWPGTAGGNPRRSRRLRPG